MNASEQIAALIQALEIVSKVVLSLPAQDLNAPNFFYGVARFSLCEAEQNIIQAIDNLKILKG